MDIAVLGPLEVHANGGVVEVAGARLRALLIRLALVAPAPMSVSGLVEALWGDDPPAEPANALQSLVSRLRRALGNADVVAQVPGGYRLLIGADDLDLHRFAQLARAGRDHLRAERPAEAADCLRQALALWRGGAFDAAIERDGALLARLQEQHLDALADRIEADLSLGRASELVAELDALVAAHPLRERLTLLRLEALAAAGRVPEALAGYETARRTLADELGIDPSPALQAAQLALLRGEPLAPRPPAAGSRLPAADEPRPAAAGTPAGAEGVSPRSNLRAQLTSFVGRDEDVRRIDKLLSEGRLVTLVGPGGAGKTRLANESVARLVDAAGIRVWLVELAPVTDASDVPQVVLAALGLRDSTLIDGSASIGARDAVGRLVDFLADRECLVVLDNCEHLIDAAAVLTDELLGRCPSLRILTTSREPLGVYGEVLVGVAPLGQPAVDADPAEAMSYPATQLFLDRAVAVRPDFVVDELTVRPVVDIVRRLDGLPLAIELAAARLRSMSVDQVAARLTDRFRLLTGGSRTALPRHRTLLAVVEWSWDLLSEDERRLARRLAVFVGGVTVASAADICASSELPQDLVDDLLTSLVDKSLLQLVPDESTSARYRMLETLREFGLERMAELGEVTSIRAAHARHFAALAALADPMLRTRDQLVWLAVLDAERDNIVAALRYLADDGAGGAALDIALSMNWYWVLMGRHAEAATWTGLAIAAAGDYDETKQLVAQALVAINSAASMWNGSGDDVAARMTAIADINTRLDQIVQGEDIHPLVRVLRPVMALLTSDLDLAERLVSEALTSSDPWTVASVRTFRAAIAENEGDTERVRADAEQSLAELRELGERWGTANCLQLLAPLNAMEGNLDQAAAEYREALELFGILGALEDESLIRLRLADVLYRQGDVDAARAEIEYAVHRRETATPQESLFGSLDRESLYARTLLAEIELQSGNLAQARALRDESLELVDDLSSPHPAQGHISAMIYSLAAKIDLADGLTASAGEHLVDSFRLGVETRDMPVVAAVGVTVATYAHALGRSSDAVEILGAATALRGAHDSTAPDIIRIMAKLTDELGVAAVDQAYASGRSMDRQQALARLDPAGLH